MFNARRTRGICPSCGSGQVIHVLYGFPADPDAEPPWVRFGGCVIDGEPNDRECSDCGRAWISVRPGAGELTPQQQMLCDYVLSIGGTRPTPQPGGRVHFDMHGVPARVRVKEGGARIRGTVEIAEVEDESRAVEWLSIQPLSRTGELMVCRRDSGGDVLRFIWERPIDATMSAADPIAIEVGAYVAAWRKGTEASVDPVEFEVSDPRDDAPEQAWLLFGDDASWPTMDELDEQQESGDAGIFEPVWTAAKQTQVGDLLLMYFGGSRKGVHFVARAASPAFYTSDIDVNTEGEVRRQQWWVFHTPLIPIKQIPFSALKAASNDQLILRGRSGKFLAPAAIAGLEFEALDPAYQAAVKEVAEVPTGRSDLPDPEAMTWREVKQIAGGALRLESDVEKYIVEPLLRDCLEGTELRFAAQHAIGRKRADFVVLEADRPTCVVEVKLAINDSGDWARSPDLSQVIDYAAALDCPAVLIDTQRIVLIERGASTPSRIIERANLDTGVMLGGTLHDLAEHLGVRYVHRSNGYKSWRERPRQSRGPRRRSGRSSGVSQTTARPRPTSRD